MKSIAVVQSLSSFLACRETICKSHTSAAAHSEAVPSEIQ